MNQSLRMKLLLGTGVASMLILGCLAVGLYVAIRLVMLRSFDASLRAKARTLAAMVEQEHQGVVFEYNRETMPEFQRQEHPWYFEIWVAGHAWQKSAMLREASLQQGDDGAEPRAQWLKLPDHKRGRWIAQRFEPRRDESATAPSAVGTITVAGDTEEMEEQLADEAWMIGIACALAVIVSGVALMFVVNRALRPVDIVALRIDRLKEDHLRERISTAGIPAELVPVVERLNGLLARLEEAFERQRGFTADAAHELRTPLAGMKTTLEVCRSRSRDEAAYAAAIDKSLGIVGAMQRMVENLLMLARAEGGQLQLAAELVDVEAVITEAVEAFVERAKGRRLRVEWDANTGCLAEANAEALRMVIVNVLENAVTYADVGGTVRLVATCTTDGTEIIVSNTGSTIAEKEVGRVFERFWRHDSARSQTGMHAGLGLSLCERLVGMMGGRMTATSSNGVFAMKVALRRGADGKDRLSVPPEAAAVTQ